MIKLRSALNTFLITLILLLMGSVCLASKVYVNVQFGTPSSSSYYYSYPYYSYPYQTVWVPGHWERGWWVPGQYVQYFAPGYVEYQGGWVNDGRWHRSHSRHHHHR